MQEYAKVKIVQTVQCDILIVTFPFGFRVAQDTLCATGSIFHSYFTNRTFLNGRLKVQLLQ